MSAKVIRPYNKQDKQCTYNETMWHVKVNIVPIKTKQCVLRALLKCIPLSTI